MGTRAKREFKKNLPTARGSQSGPKFLPDHHYKVAIVKVLEKDGQDDDFFIVEAKVIESDCKKQGKGYCASQVSGLSKKSAAGNVASFLRAAITVASRDPDNGLGDERDPNDDDDWEDLEELYDAVIEDENPLEGTVLYLRTKEIITEKGKGHPFTVHDWFDERPPTWDDGEDEDEEEEEEEEEDKPRKKKKKSKFGK